MQGVPPVCICFSFCCKFRFVFHHVTAFQVAVTAFKPEGKQHIEKRLAEAAELKKTQCKTFLHRKRGWTMRRDQDIKIIEFI